ncbi:MAG: hypothetical protein CMH26_02865 [Micavibrio sp.]|nr:hypothetical protein [Micavibrio sp.]|tara:strand:+ start:1123 stop:1593 length:471 start_codon:yes stop_codon:yes gene_type:complete
MKLLPALFLTAITTLTISMTSPQAHAKQQASPLEGSWLTENERAIIKIERCNDNNLCGYVDWIIEGGLQKDIHNEDESLHERPICGLKILGDFTQESPTEWEDGFIYKADDGDTYNANLELTEPDTLKLRGYIGISLLGKTQYWTRTDKSSYKACE